MTQPAAAAAAAAAAVPDRDTLSPPPLGISNPNPSESWNGPDDIDGALIRRTYAHFDLLGVPGDGVVDGIEYTRERTHPLPFAWSPDRRSSSRTSNSSRPTEQQQQQKRDKKEEDEQRLIDERLSKLDRYGFFANSVETSSHAKYVVLSIDSSQVPDPVQTALLRREHESALRQRERIRIDKWARMLTVAERDDGANATLYTFRDREGIRSVAGTGRSSKKLRRRCYKGIPDRWRSVAWLALLERKADGHSPKFAELVSRYDRLLDEPSQYDVQIDLDVPRTMSGHLLFHTRYGHGQRALFHVLHAFSLHCPDCGYCQGMGPIAASLLCYFEPSHAYVALVRLHDVHHLHTIFAPGFPGLVENFFVQTSLIRWLFPRLHAMLEEHSIDPSSYATKWYITLFANSVPFETQLRMWDIIFLDGQDALVGIALGVLHGIQNGLGTTPSFESVLGALTSYVIPASDGDLMGWVGELMGRADVRARMKAAREEWAVLKANGAGGF
ncbi:unnamed protein product [Tilletia controversa]|nr:unnamed protein product [Tilletia controversa]CAD6932733.1 unnamed protein product [Tilletia controversa]